MKLTAPIVVICAVALAACSPDAPLPTNHLEHHHGLALANLSQSTNAQTLSAIRELSAPFHNVGAAEAAGYALFKAPPLTAADGCISSIEEGGMGYHYTRGNNLGDDEVSLLDPEFLVYAPNLGPRKDGEARTRLAAFEYFLPFTTKWPSPDNPSFTRAPTLQDFPTTSSLPSVAFTPTSRFNGWMLHIWLWENNADGAFANFNEAVPLCEGSAF